MKFRPIQNNNSKLKIASSPFTHNQQSTSQVMLWVTLAALPGILSQIYFFGLGTIYQIVIAIIVALVTEALCVKLKKEDPLLYLKDNSALLTGVLLAISNPAMVGYVVLLISFPVQMTSWMPPVELQAVSYNVMDSLSIFFTGHTSSGLTLEDLRRSVDGITQATPLDSFKTGLLTHPINEVLATPILQGEFAGIGWQWVNVAYLVGGLILLYKRIISWHIPVAMISVLALCSVISWGIDPTRYSQPLLQLFSGATMLGAFFIATDPVSASTTPKGRLIYAGMIGLLVWIIRVYGGYPDAVAFSVLLANIAVPLIDSYTRPRVYGH